MNSIISQIKKELNIFKTKLILKIFKIHKKKILTNE